MVNSADSCLNVGGISPHCGQARGRAGGVAGYYCVAAHEGVALYSASSVYSGLLFSSSFRRMMSARRHSQGGDCGSDSFLAEPEFPHRLDAAGPVLFGRLRYPAVNSKRFCGGRCPRGPCGRCLACRDRIQQCWCLRYIGVSSGCFGPPSLGIGNHFARRNQASKYAT